MENLTTNQPVAASVTTNATTIKPGTPLPKDQAKSNRKLVVGCITAFGCSIFLLVAVLVGFLAFGSTTNPIFSFLGVAPTEVVNVLLSLVNLIFLFLVFSSFVFAVIGVFRITTAKKDDKDAKRRGAIFTAVSVGVTMLLVITWIFSYFFLASKQTVSPQVAIATTPDKTINITGPITIKFDASKAPINRTQFDVLGYRWDFGDDTILTGNPQTHTYDKVGNFKTTLTISVKEKATGRTQEVQFSRDVTIQNILANVVIKVDRASGQAPLTVNFDGSGSKSPNGEITGYAWDLNGDGVYNEGTTAKLQKTFESVGTYNVSLRVTDSTGAPATADLTIEAMLPDTPTAVIKVQEVTGSDLEVGKAYIFSGVDSTSTTGMISKYSWEFGDNTKSATRSATHTYKTAGPYDVTLTVTDSAGKTGDATVRFNVKTPATSPLVSLKTTPETVNNVVSGQAPFNVIFDASASNDANNDIIDYAWDFNGDGKTDDTNAVTSYTFTQAGTFNVKLTVSDATNLSTSQQTVVTVTPAGLKADIKATTVAGTVPLKVSFDASGSSYPSGRIVSYEWDFGDSIKPRIDTAKVTYQYSAVGSFTAKVTAISSDNKRSSAEVQINVRPVSVTACFEPSSDRGPAPLQVAFDPTCSTGTVVKYTWTFGSAGASTDRKPIYTFTAPGDYDVILEVSDAQNVIDTITKKITVLSKPTK